jgi:hypothetical protein
MPSVKYVGPHDGVEVPMPNGTLVTVMRGELLETDGEHVAGLLEQPSNWEAAKRAAPVKEKKEGDD